MQFSISALAALTLSLISLASAAPAPATSLADRQSQTTVDVSFQGADAPTDFTITVIADGTPQQVGENYLSISYITYDRYDFACVFTAEFDQPPSPATATYACSGDNCQVGPPQPVYTVSCTECSQQQGPYCDGYGV